MKFTAYRLHPSLQENLTSAGFFRTTDIQFKAIPSIMKGEDLLAIAQTGTGKTAAFAIPIIELLLQQKRMEGIFALVLVPTRELAMQIHGVFSSFCKGTGVKPLAVVGGVEYDGQKDRIEKGANILIATPGRMFDLLHQKILDVSKARILVLDEADRMLQLGFNKDIRHIKKLLPLQHQTLFFSATIDAEIKRLAYAVVRNAIRIQVSPENTVNPNITHQVAHIAMDDKRFFLERIIKQNGGQRMLVFVRTRVRAQRVEDAMKRVGLQVLSIHGDKEQAERFKTLAAFEAGESDVLVTTDVSARGIDLKRISFVINYDLPEDAENYVHRVGRTGRGMEKGYAISFCSSEEQPLLLEIEKFIGGKVDVLELPKDEYATIVDDATREADKISMKSIKAMIAEDEANARKAKRKKK